MCSFSITATVQPHLEQLMKLNSKLQLFGFLKLSSNSVCPHLGQEGDAIERFLSSFVNKNNFSFLFTV
jgi:hypothetical protein